MNHSIALQGMLFCPKCNQLFFFDLWQIIDTAERPELVEKIQSGTLHDIYCPNCNELVTHANSPLLLYSPNRDPFLIYSPAQGTRQEENQQKFDELIEQLKQSIGSSEEMNGLQKALVIPHPILSIFCQKGLEVAQAAMREHLGTYEHSRSNDPEIFKQIENQTRQKQIILSLLNARSLDEFNCILDASHSTISLPWVLKFIDQVIEQYREKPDAVQELTFKKNLLIHYLEVGVTQAVEEISGSINEPVPLELRLDLAEAQEADHRYQEGDSSAMEQSIAAWQRVLQHPAFQRCELTIRLSALNNAGGMFWHRYMENGQVSDLDMAVDLCRQVVELTPSGSPARISLLTNLGTVLGIRYSLNGNLDDLDTRIRIYRELVELTSSNSPERPDRLNYLGNRLYDRYDLNGDLADLEAAIRAYKEAVELFLPDSSELPSCLYNLGSGLSIRYALSRELVDLEAAIRAHEEAVELTLPDSPDKPDRLNNLGNSLNDRYNLSGNPADLEAAIRAYQQAVELSPPGSPVLPSCLNNLGIGLTARYTHTEDLADLDAGICANQQAVSLTPLDSPNRPAHINNLGAGLMDRFNCRGNLVDLDDAIRAFTQVVELTPPGSPDKPTYIINLGAILMDRYERTGNLVDLDAGISAYMQATELLLPSSPKRSGCLIHLGLGLRNRYILNGDVADLEAAICANQQAMELTPPGSPDLLDNLTGLGSGFMYRYIHNGDVADLEASIRAYQQAVELSPPGSLSPDHLSNLGSGLRNRYARSGDLADLEAAIRAYQEAVDLNSSSIPEKPGLHTNLGNGLRDRYVHNGNLADLEASICAFQEAVKLTPLGSPELPCNLNNMGLGLMDRYIYGGNLVDLEAGVNAYQQAVALTPPGSPDRSDRLTNLGNGLISRFTRSGDLVDLEAAIRALYEGVQLTPPGSPEMPRHLNNLGNGLILRYNRSGDLNDLEAGIRAYQEAVDLTPPGSSEMSRHLNNLGSGLGSRYVRSGNLADIEAAIRTAQQAVELTPANSPELPRNLNNLGSGFMYRYARSRDLADLETGIRAYQQAVETTSPDSPERPVYLTNLGSGFMNRYVHSSDPADLEAGKKAFYLACRDGSELALEVVLNASHNWSDWAIQRQQWQEAVTALGFGSQTLALLFKTQLDRSAKENWLEEAKGLPQNHAFALAKLGQFEEAVTVLENGRARLLGEALEQNRLDLEILKDHGEPGKMANETYRLAMERIRFLEAQKENRSTDWGDQNKKAQQDLDAAIVLIQSIPGYENFLRAMAFEEIAANANTIPLIYLITTSQGGLVLGILNGKMESIWLDALTDKVVREEIQGSDELNALGGYLGAYFAWRQNPQDETAFKHWLAVLDSTTLWLWDTFMGKVVELLKANGFKKAILIPTGLLGLLPLQAAWHPDNSSITGKRYALDDACISFAPSARALVAVSKNASRPAKILLSVDNPDGSLAFSNLEVLAAQEHFEPGSRLHLAGENASLEAVKEKAAAAHVLHFSTHGIAGFSEPLRSYLLLANGKSLTLKDILELRFDFARLAVLSACETGIPGTQLPDEVVSLSTGFIQAGVPGSIGSLWSVNDASTMILIARFYDNWLDQHLEPAEALQQAQIWLRDTTNEEKANLFKDLPEPMSHERIPWQTAQGAYRRILLEDIQDRTFSHPFWWAAFRFTGI